MSLYISILKVLKNISEKETSKQTDFLSSLTKSTWSTSMREASTQILFDKSIKKCVIERT